MRFYSFTLLSILSSLFPDVVNCMQTDNLEVKKLVYLYLMNYAKTQPDMAIMAVNTFVKVSSITSATVFLTNKLSENFDQEDSLLHLIAKMVYDHLASNPWFPQPFSCVIYLQGMIVWV